MICFLVYELLCHYNIQTLIWEQLGDPPLPWGADLLIRFQWLASSMSGGKARKRAPSMVYPASRSTALPAARFEMGSSIN